MHRRRSFVGWMLVAPAVLLAAAERTAALPYSPRVGEPYPQIVLPTIEGDRVVALSSFRGQKVLLVHFASWDEDSRRALPVWNEKTKALVDSQKLVVIGVAQEQHADRCWLFAQWQGIAWPILHDPLNLVGIQELPAVVAIDEHGIVRDVKPQPDTIAESFALMPFSPPAKPIPMPPEELPDPRVTRRYAQEGRRSENWRNHGDALVLAGLPPQIDEAIKAYGDAVRLDPRDAAAFFRLGVAYRLRFDRPQRQPGDFQAAIDAWQKAAKLRPRNAVFRRRVQQYGPQVDRRFAFYGWVEAAQQALASTSRDRKGAETIPVALSPEPTPAECARSERQFRKRSIHGPEGDPRDKVAHDRDGLIELTSAVVRGTEKGNRCVAEVHLIFRPSAKADARWTSDAEPLRAWIAESKSGEFTRRFVEHPNPASASSAEERTLNFAVKLPAMQKRTVTITGYALYNVRAGDDGERRLLRQDFKVQIKP